MSIMPPLMLPEEHDLVIIGAGPAGISAAINAAIRQIDFIIVERNSPMEKVCSYNKVINYPGLGQISGKDLGQAFQNHIQGLGISITKENITKIILSQPGKYRLFGHDKVYQAKKVILSPGIIYSQKIQGEAELLGHGVSYCLTCDALLYAGKKVGVIAETPEGEGEAVILQQDYNCKIIFYPLYNPGREIAFDEVHLDPKLIKLERKDQGLNIIEPDRTILVDGIFIFRRAKSPTDLLPELMMANHNVKVNRNMETNLSGLFCAGDCTGPPYQIGKAVGEGQVAALTVLKQLKTK